MPEREYRQVYVSALGVKEDGSEYHIARGIRGNGSYTQMLSRALHKLAEEINNPKYTIARVDRVVVSPEAEEG